MVLLPRKDRSLKVFFAICVCISNIILCILYASKAASKAIKIPRIFSPEKINIKKSTFHGEMTVKQFGFTTAMCTILKDAEAYLEEWIDYHLLAVNFQHIYVYDNSDGFDLSRWSSNTRSHPLYSRVTVIHYPKNETKGALPPQRGAYLDCLERFGRNGPKHDYLAMIDIDEFLVIQNNTYTEIRDVLQTYLVPYGGSLTVNWMLFGTSNHTVYAPLPVTRRFQYRDNKPFPTIKSIVKSTDALDLRNPHAFSLKNGSKARTTKFPGALQKKSATGASDPDKPSDVLLVYHYRSMSLKEKIFKNCLRGNLGNRWCQKNGMAFKSDLPDHMKPRHGDIFDDRAWKALTSAAPKYKFYESENYFG